MNKGFIRISNELYVTDWNKIYLFMKDFRPTHIEFRHWENDMWYMYGVSNMFDKLKEGDIIPEYSVIFTQDNKGSVTYMFDRC